VIARVIGHLLEVRLTSVVVDVNGLGYEVLVAPDIAASVQVGEKVDLFTSQVIREDSSTLFGFKNVQARELFNQVQTVTGVGPKVAHSLLSNFSPDELRNAIGSADLKALEKVPGIGKKVASRIVLELQDKFGGSNLQKDRLGGKWRASLKDALTSLGYSSREADQAIDKSLETISNPDDLDLSELLKITLSQAKR
jgi:Holliday junction DNA helicase RuvA